MKLLIRAAMVFFATLLAAALFALGVPALAELVARAGTPRVAGASAQVLVAAHSLIDQEAGTRAKR